MGRFTAMVWGGIAKGYRTDLFVMEMKTGKKYSYNSHLYGNVLEEYACSIIDEEHVYF
jgi:hypothetical protein